MHQSHERTGLIVKSDEPASKRKKHLNETELALKREETARKRKNLSVKKLEDEKVRVYAIVRKRSVN
jgi:Ino eighty subunit 2